MKPPMFRGPVQSVSTSGQIRTDTERDLNPLPLPLGYTGEDNGPSLPGEGDKIDCPERTGIAHPVVPIVYQVGIVVSRRRGDISKV